MSAECAFESQIIQTREFSQSLEGVIFKFNPSRYEIRRDDPTPAPWSKEGKKRMEDMGSEIFLIFKINFLSKSCLH